MPIVINELVFKGTVGEAAADREKPAAAKGQAAVLDQRAMVEACVEEVLRVLERQKER